MRILLFLLVISSILQAQEEEKRQFDFDEEVSYAAYPQQGLRNVWLLIIVCALFPFT